MHFFVAICLSLEVAIAAARLENRQTLANIPDFVTKYGIYKPSVSLAHH
jgi:hypothetical protein